MTDTETVRQTDTVTDLMTVVRPSRASGTLYITDFTRRFARLTHKFSLRRIRRSTSLPA